MKWKGTGIEIDGYPGLAGVRSTLIIGTSLFIERDHPIDGRVRLGSLTDVQLARPECPLRVTSGHHGHCVDTSALRAKADIGGLRSRPNADALYENPH